MWQPTASNDAILLRAKVLNQFRKFFAERQVLEVDTPLLAHSTIPDPNIHSFSASFRGEKLYLQTSPEFAMKRLLAFGLGSIYQICKAFRDNEAGDFHNPEFSILEWYRIGFDHFQLMDEMDEMFKIILGAEKGEKITYKELFLKHLNIDPLNSNVAKLKQIALQKGLNEIPDLDYDGWLNLLMSVYIEPYLGVGRPTFVYNYPISQAALAKQSDNDSNVAERFEVYIDGVELANGFHELTDPSQQRERFLKELSQRKANKLPRPLLDERFLAALKSGMPNCAGVALGIDRLLMVALNAKSIAEVLTFPVDVS